MTSRQTLPCLAVLLMGAVWLGACGDGDDGPFGGTSTTTTTVPDAGVEPDGGDLDAAPPPDDAGQDAAGEREPGAPLFGEDEVASFAATLPGSNDPADVYHPAPPDLATGDYLFPVAVLLQGAEVARQHYAGFARGVARYGFAVVVPDHESMSITGPGLYTQNQVVVQVLDYAVAENQGAGALAGKLDVDTVVLLGHSYGGVVGLYVIQNVCQYPFCSGAFTRPAAVAGGAFYGTNMRGPLGGPIGPVNNQGLAVALVQGSVDGLASPADALETFQQIQVPPKALVSVEGANHYGLCDGNNPDGAQADPSSPTLDQGLAQETAARWSAVFLRATVLGDPLDLEYLSSTGPAQDVHVTVTYTP